jgi:hypothetical protein
MWKNYTACAMHAVSLPMRFFMFAKLSWDFREHFSQKRKFSRKFLHKWKIREMKFCEIPQKLAHFRKNLKKDFCFISTNESGNPGVQFDAKQRLKILWDCPFKRNTKCWMPDCPASCQSGTGLKITNDAVHGPVPE